MLTDSSVLPRCEKCGEVLRLNGRGDDTFLHDPYLSAQMRLISWVKSIVAEGKRLLVVEIGCGGSTPTVIRFPCEGIARAAGQNARFVRVNISDPEIPRDILGLSVRSGAKDFLVAVYDAHSAKTGGDNDEKKALAAQQSSGLSIPAPRYDWEQLLVRLR